MQFFKQQQFHWWLLHVECRFQFISNMIIYADTFTNIFVTWKLETLHQGDHDYCHVLCLSGNKIYCPSNLIARYSSWIAYWNEFLSVGWTSGILGILKRWNCSDLSIRRIWRTTCKVSDIMKDWCFMNLYMYHIFSLCHAAKANLGCETNLVSSLIINEVRLRGA